MTLLPKYLLPELLLKKLVKLRPGEMKRNGSEKDGRGRENEKKKKRKRGSGRKRKKKKRSESEKNRNRRNLRRRESPKQMIHTDQRNTLCYVISSIKKKGDFKKLAILCL